MAVPPPASPVGRRKKKQKEKEETERRKTKPNGMLFIYMLSVQLMINCNDMKTVLSTLFLLSFTLNAFSQDEKIEPERPSETQSASTVGKKTFQLEAGFKIEKTEDMVHHTAEPEFLLRLGLLEKLEFRLESEVSRYSTKTATGHQVVSGLQPVSLGFKTALLKGNHWIPETALIADITIPGLSSGQFKTDHAAPHVRLAFQNEVSKKLQLGYNLAAEWDGTEPQPEYIYTFSPALEVSPSCQVYLETYGHFKNHESPETSLDGGLLFFVNDNISLDISSGVGLSKHAPAYFVSLGGAIRFK
jgi:hypothetical protein